jgi:hypothetical protein
MSTRNAEIADARRALLGAGHREHDDEVRDVA